MSNELVVFAYQGRDVAFDPAAQMWNLNAMHQAAGGASHKSPHKWLATVQAREFTAALAEKLGEIPPSLVVTREGRGGGTWAHWQIAAAYAHYLRPDFYIQWNEWAMQGAQQERGRLAQLEARVAQLEGRRRPARPQLTREAVLAAVAAHGPITMPDLYVVLLPSTDERVPEFLRHLRMLKRHDKIRELPCGCYEATGA